MIVNMGMHECDSFDEQDIDDLQSQLQQLEGPSLKHFQMLQQESPITTFASQDIIKSLLDQEGKDLKFIGKDEHASFRAFFYVLLLLGVQEKKYYPHLNTLIRQQFYKPNIFAVADQGRGKGDSKQLLEKSLRYFHQINEGSRIEEYISKEPLFADAGVLMLRNSVQEDDERGVLEQLVAKFNIDLHVLRRESQSEVLQLGSNMRFHIFREGEYYFVGTTQQKEDLGQSRLDIESVRSGESGLLLIPQHSDQSTPKFKNSQVKFRKKSHKNSFGGDLQVVQYRDLLHLQSQKLMTKPKVLSQFYDLNDAESCADTKFQAEPKKHTFQDIIDGEEVNILKPEMKGSTTMEPYQNLAERRKDRKISSSEIIEYKDFSNRLHRHDSLPQPTADGEDKTYSYSSLVVLKEESHQHQNSKLRTSLITQGPLQRIEERQSSQRESTHPDAQSQRSEQAEISLENESQVKLKDRKYSYFTQQMASNKTRKQKEIQGSNYVFKIPKNSHKNSQYIESGGHEFGLHYRRFQQNPLRFSQLGAPSEQSGFDSAMQHYQLSRQRQLRINSSLYSYSVKFQPQNWFKKEVIYHLPGNQKEILVFERTYPMAGGGGPAPASHQQNYHAQSLPETQVYPPTSIIRDSFGSSNSLPSQIQMKQPHSHSVKNEPCQTSKGYNPFELNQTSFLKQRIQSMVNLQPLPRPEQDDSKSFFASSRSMKEIKPDREVAKSPIKINFNYAPSNSTMHSPPSLMPSSPLLRRVQHSEPLQFKSVQTLKSPTHIGSFGSAPREVVFGQGQDQFFKAPLR